MKDLCYSVRLQSLTSISDKCCKAVGFNGSEALIPKQFVYEQDWDVSKSEAWWISTWILERKNIQYSSKKQAWFDRETGRQLPTYTFEKHVPEKVENINVEPDANLTR